MAWRRRIHLRSRIICWGAGCRPANELELAMKRPVESGAPDSLDARTGAMDEPMDFQAAAPKIPPRILCIGMPVRDLTFRIEELPERGFKVNASHFEEICGGNALNAAIGIVRLGGRASICGPMGDVREASAKYIFEKLAHEGIDTKHIMHMQGLVTPISNIM